MARLKYRSHQTTWRWWPDAVAWLGIAFLLYPAIFQHGRFRLGSVVAGAVIILACAGELTKRR